MVGVRCSGGVDSRRKAGVWMERSEGSGDGCDGCLFEVRG